MADNKSILHELYVFSEWKPEPEYLQKPDSIFPENISALWRWLNFFGPKKSLIDSVTAHKEHQQKWHIALGDEGKVIGVLTDNILEIRTKRSEYATIAARTTVSRDAYPQWRKLVWSPDCSFIVLAYGNGIVSFFDLTASNLYNIPADCSRPGGLECTDNTHAVADIIFMPLRVKDTKWSWEVAIVTYDGRLRGYVVSQSEAFELHHSFRFPGGVSSLAYSQAHATLYVAGVPRPALRDSSSPITVGITAWRILNDDPFYKLSVVSDELEAQLANKRFELYIPFVSSKNLPFIVQMVLSPDGSKLVCLHCNGEISMWRLPLLKLLRRFPLSAQPSHDMRNPLTQQRRYDAAAFYAADVSWWSNEEIILSRFSGSVTVCKIDDMQNILGNKPEFLQGTPRLTCAYDNTFIALECESNVLPAKKSRSDDGMEVVKVDAVQEESMLELMKEIVKSVVYAITDLEACQPRPRRLTVLARVYRLLAVKSTTPEELFARKIESGLYGDALALAQTFGLDSDLVYQQQWRRNPVSTEAIEKYLSKVSKKIWAVHQCVDRLPETLPAAKELLQFGLMLTNEIILDEINKDRGKDKIKTPDDIKLEDLNAYTSELLRCRHVMLFYKERLKLYELILKHEKSNYVKDEYDRLRSNSILRSSMEIAREGRVEALTCLWPNIKTVTMKLAVLENMPETVNPLAYQHLLPTKHPLKECFDIVIPSIKIQPCEYEPDWCRKETFRSIWNSNWSEDASPESETSEEPELQTEEERDAQLSAWYEKRARQVERLSGLAGHALVLITLASFGGGVPRLKRLIFHLLTLSTLLYELNVEGVTLEQLESMSLLETCKKIMQNSTMDTIVEDLKQFMIPFLKRYEILTSQSGICIMGLTDYLESVSVDDLSIILHIMQSRDEYRLDMRTHLQLVERCLIVHNRTDQFDKACDLLNTILRDCKDGTISLCELVRRVTEMERVVNACIRCARRGLALTVCEVRETVSDPPRARLLLTRLARSAHREEKPTTQEWGELLKDILELQASLFTCVTKEECYRIYASSLLTSGDASSIRLASEVLTGTMGARRATQLVDREDSIQLALSAAREYVNSASSLTDPALDLARCCLNLIEGGIPEIQEELDFLGALQMLKAFNLNILPIQVRLCEDRMTLIEDCLKSDPNAYLACHKLLKLAKLLRIAGDDESTREAQVLVSVGARACAAGAWGAGSRAAGRLAALRYAGAAPLLARVAAGARAHADTRTRTQLRAAAAAALPAALLDQLLRDRLELQLESMEQIGAILKEHHLIERRFSADEEFDDAVTTPVIERKDLVVPQEENKPIYDGLLDSFQRKLIGEESDSKGDSEGVRCPEFYRSLYPELETSPLHYAYDQFTAPDPSPANALLHWYYVYSSIKDNCSLELEQEISHMVAIELVHQDTPISVACLMRGVPAPSSLSTDTAVSVVLYATLVRSNAAQLRDNVYLTEPATMARSTMRRKIATKEHMKIIQECVARLSGSGEVEQLRKLGVIVNGPMFNADKEYRAEIISRLASSSDKSHVEFSCVLASKYGACALDVYLVHVGAHGPTAHPPPAAALLPDAYTRIKDTMWPLISGTDHNGLINFFTILRNIDEKPIVFNLTAAEHIKTLKKVKSASAELDYKVLCGGCGAEEWRRAVLRALRPESAAAVGRVLRALPPALRPPAPLPALYCTWLQELFFSVPTNASTNKKWMQQYRLCSSYFNKLGKEELLEFIKITCFSLQAIERVPAGTRSVMIMQAVDYCQQEHENDHKLNKNEQSWVSVGQEMTRWARFLDNFYSDTVRNIIRQCMPPSPEIWCEMEMTHGDTQKVLEVCGKLLLCCEVRSGVMGSLLQCVGVAATPKDVVLHLATHLLEHDAKTVVLRIIMYYKEGVKVPDEVLEEVSVKGLALGLSGAARTALRLLVPRHSSPEEQPAIARTLLNAHFSNIREYTDEELSSEEGLRSLFTEILPLANTVSRRQALADVLNCWPRPGNDEFRSVHSGYLKSLLTFSDQNESLILIKVLLQQPVLIEEEVKWVVENVPSEAAINALWVVLLSKCDSCLEDTVLELIQEHEEYLKKREIEDELVVELLDNGLFLKLVSTPVYESVINYILKRHTAGEESGRGGYTVKWASSELMKANLIAEAGHLQLLAMGVPSPLRSFSQSFYYAKKMLNK